MTLLFNLSIIVQIYIVVDNKFDLIAEGNVISMAFG